VREIVSLLALTDAPYDQLGKSRGQIMTTRAAYLASAAILALSAFAAQSAQATYVITFEEVGSDVVEVGGGTIDLTGLDTFGSRQGAFATIQPDAGVFVSGTGEATIYTGLTSAPSNFGSGGRTSANTSNGDGIVLFDNIFAISEGYTSGAPLSETSTYIDATFASLGMTPGAYVWTWGSGVDADSLTINIVASPPPVPEPSTWAMMLIGFAGLGYAGYRTSRKSAALAA
jgi:hypothetical protein